jgi:hypothetical protein
MYECLRLTDTDRLCPTLCPESDSLIQSHTESDTTSFMPYVSETGSPTLRLEIQSGSFPHRRYAGIDQPTNRNQSVGRVKWRTGRCQATSLLASARQTIHRGAAYHAHKAPARVGGITRGADHPALASKAGEIRNLLARLAFLPREQIGNPICSGQEVDAHCRGVVPEVGGRSLRLGVQEVGL